MPTSPEFPHLNLTCQGPYHPRFNGRPSPDPTGLAIRAAPAIHAEQLRAIFAKMRQFHSEVRRLRLETGLPDIPADKGFLIKMPEGVDVDAIIRALGVELVAETENGLMLVSSVGLALSKIEAVLTSFAAGSGNIAAASSIRDIVWEPTDRRRLQEMLSPEVLALWPFVSETVYVFDLGIQTAASTREVSWPRLRRRSEETGADFAKRRETAREKAWLAANREWDEKADIRVDELKAFIGHYGGEFVSGLVSSAPNKRQTGMIFPDSFQVRIRMTGAGFRDVIENFAHVFDVVLPPDVHCATLQASSCEVTPGFDLRPPTQDAPTVCVIDSGIQEEHRWLAPAVDKAVSRAFLPDADPNDVADYVSPQGHGTRVAGAVLYPNAIPTTGSVVALAWIQNARVLNKDNKLPETLTPEEYLLEVVKHFHRPPRCTKLFNHSINADVPCPTQRMTSWAAKLDQLSHEHDVLFIQSAGNQNRDNGNVSNPGLCDHLAAGRLPPDHQLQSSMRVANPAQSLHALTVGSVSDKAFDDGAFRSFALDQHYPSGFSRSGYGEPWSVVKPDVVEVGGDLIHSKAAPFLVRQHRDVSIELLNSTMYGEPAYSKDGVGTSFATPKVSHIAAHLQSLFPNASPLLYRALIVHSARWPSWAEGATDKDRVLRLIGYGVPSLERASRNSDTRVTLITPDAEFLPSKQLHLYTVRVPEELRNAALDAKVRVDITLAYTALPRRTRARRTGYLETWLDWEASRYSEPKDAFLKRMQEGGKAEYTNFPWTLHMRDDWGEVQQTSRKNGSLQKDWAVFEPFNLPAEFAIAVRSHKGWNHLEGASAARYCLAVSFEVLEGELPIYALIENEVRLAAGEIRVRT